MNVGSARPRPVIPPEVVLTNAELFERARRVIPGGVNSPVRAFGAVGGLPYFASKAEGAHVWDVEGNRYLDLVQSYGAVIAGHAHPAVVDAVVSAAADGTTFGAPTEREVQLAEAIVEALPSVERVRLVSSGTEAAMSAVRLARGFTGRSRIVKFAGCYHGHSDSLLVSGGSGVATLGLPGSAGVTEAQVAETLVVPYNEVPELDERVACVLVEPVAANMGLVLPEPGFLEGLRTACDEVGALLVFDEVVTGFRLGRGGAQERYGVRPDLTCLGKVIGGGLPIGAFGGRADVMDQLAPIGPVYQAGTLSGNPLATAAGLATLELLDALAYERIEESATRLAEGLGAVLGVSGGEVTISRLGGLVGIFCGGKAPRDYDEARSGDEAAYAAIFRAMAQRGVALAPSPYEVAFVGLAHTPDVIDRILTAAEDLAL